ncbi:hypothetical protein CsSME_00047182 [Camellia sinensis var. sinensis]
MAPSRRKGGGRAAAAAARRQWKVGDLVLAKVKGFPAWPATVSDPEKWGYSADWKKVHVYFFGTQQIDCKLWGNAITEGGNHMGAMDQCWAMSLPR